MAQVLHLKKLNKPSPVLCHTCDNRPLKVNTIRVLLIKVYVVLVTRVLYAGPVTLSLCSLLVITVGRIRKRQQNVKIQRRLHCVAGFFCLVTLFVSYLLYSSTWLKLSNGGGDGDILIGL